MGSLTAMTRRPMSPARARLISAAQAARYGLKELSALLGRNHSYLQQYVVKGSPRVLPEDVRHRLAELLGVPEAELREPSEQPTNRSAGAVAVAAAAAVAVSVRRLPILIEGGQLEPGEPAWPLSDMVAGADERSMALILTEAHGVFQPRNVLLCDPAPARAGDLAVMLAGPRVLAIGLVLPAPRGTVALAPCDSDEPHASFPADQGRLWRVLAVRAA